MQLDFYLCQKKICCSYIEKYGFGAYIVSARLAKQHIDSVNPILGYTSLFITGALTSAHKNELSTSITWKVDWKLKTSRDLRKNSLSAITFFDAGCWPAMQHQKPKDQRWLLW
jgi:hypothetical protein